MSGSFGPFVLFRRHIHEPDDHTPQELDRQLMFQLLNKLCERTTVIITTNLRFSEWATVFGDAKMTTALLDRLTHRCHILDTENDSYRFKASSETAKKKRKETAPLTTA